MFDDQQLTRVVRAINLTLLCTVGEAWKIEPEFSETRFTGLNQFVCVTVGISIVVAIGQSLIVHIRSHFGLKVGAKAKKMPPPKAAPASDTKVSESAETPEMGVETDKSTAMEPEPTKPEAEVGSEGKEDEKKDEEVTEEKKSEEVGEDKEEEKQPEEKRDESQDAEEARQQTWKKRSETTDKPLPTDDTIAEEVGKRTSKERQEELARVAEARRKRRKERGEEMSSSSSEALGKDGAEEEGAEEDEDPKDASGPVKPRTEEEFDEGQARGHYKWEYEVKPMKIPELPLRLLEPMSYLERIKKRSEHFDCNAFKPEQDLDNQFVKVMLGETKCKDLRQFASLDKNERPLIWQEYIARLCQAHFTETESTESLKSLCSSKIKDECERIRKVLMSKPSELLPRSAATKMLKLVEGIQSHGKDMGDYLHEEMNHQEEISEKRKKVLRELDAFKAEEDVMKARKIQLDEKYSAVEEEMQTSLNAVETLRQGTEMSKHIELWLKNTSECLRLMATVDPKAMKHTLDNLEGPDDDESPTMEDTEEEKQLKKVNCRIDARIDDEMTVKNRQLKLKISELEKNAEKDRATLDQYNQESQELLATNKKLEKKLEDKTKEMQSASEKSEAEDRKAQDDLKSQ